MLGADRAFAEDGPRGAPAALVDLLRSRPSPVGYQGPRLTPPLPPSEKKPASQLAVLRLWYATEIAERFASLRASVEKNDPKPYRTFLAEYSKTAQACAPSLPPAVAVALEAYLRAPDGEEKEDALADLNTATKDNLSEDAEQCLASALAKWSPQGVLLEGRSLLAKGPAGERRDMETAHKTGEAYVLWSQPVTAWPGRADSVTGILDPQRGPFRIQATFSLYVGGERQFDDFFKPATIKVKDYVFHTKNRYVLVSGEDNEPLGWLNADDAASFVDSNFVGEKPPNRSGWKSFYTSGAPAFLHGTWWNPDGQILDPNQKVPNAVPIYTYDFLNTVTLTIKPGGLQRPSDPYSDVMTTTDWSYCHLEVSERTGGICPTCEMTRHREFLAVEPVAEIYATFKGGLVKLSLGGDGYSATLNGNHFVVAQPGYGGTRKTILGKIFKLKQVEK